MTNEGSEPETAVEPTVAEEEDVAAYIAYVGRSSFRMEHVSPPGNDNDREMPEAGRREDTLRIRISARGEGPGPETSTESGDGPEELRAPASPLVALLVARLELPRWTLAAMTLVVFTSGVLVAASVVGSTRGATRRPPVVVAAALPPRPAVTPLVTPLPVEALAEPASRLPTAAAPASDKSAKTPPKAKTPARRSRTTTPPSDSGGGPTAITAPGWVDPFAE